MERPERVDDGLAQFSEASRAIVRLRNCMANLPALAGAALRNLGGSAAAHVNGKATPLHDTMTFRAHAPRSRFAPLFERLRVVVEAGNVREPCLVADWVVDVWQASFSWHAILGQVCRRRTTAVTSSSRRSHCEENGAGHELQK